MATRQPKAPAEPKEVEQVEVKVVDSTETPKAAEAKPVRVEELPDGRMILDF